MKKIKFKSGFEASDFPEAKASSLSKGELFHYEGDGHQRNCFLIVSGKLDVRLISGSGHETLLYHLLPGELVGELAMFGASTRIATIIANEKTQLIEIGYAEFARLMKSSVFLEKITYHFMDRYIRTHDVVCRLGQPSVGMKLCRYFKSLSEHYADVDAKEVRLRLPSHAELGKLLSCQRETVTREIKKLVQVGVITPQVESSVAVDIERMRLYLADMLDA